MKKRMKMILPLVLLCMTSACGSTNHEQSTAQTRENAQQTKDTENAVADAAPVQNVGSKGVDNSGDSEYDGTWSRTWNAEDFKKFGISDMEELDIAEVEIYDGWEKPYDSLDAGLTIRWGGVSDFDAITQYAERLFQKTDNENGGNYDLAFDEDKLVWVLNKKYETFADACLYWDKIDEYYAEWNYDKDGQVVKLTIWGAHNEEEDYVGLSLCRYNQ